MPAEPVASHRVSVSVIVVNYHAYAELEQCLASLLNQTLGDLEILVVDHDSTARHRERIERKFPEARIIASDLNPGFAAGVNRGARLASGRYLYLLNPDAVAANDVCSVLVNWLDHHPTVGVVGSMVRDQDGSIQASARRFPDITTALGGRTSWLTRVLPGNPLSRRNLLTGPEVRQPVDVDWVSGASMMIRRKAFDQIGGMDEGFFLYWEDADICYRLSLAGWQTVYHPGVAVMHLCGRSSQSSPRALAAFHESAYRYFLKHGGRAARLLSPAVRAGLNLRAWFRGVRTRKVESGSTPQNSKSHRESEAD